MSSSGQEDFVFPSKFKLVTNAPQTGGSIGIGHWHSSAFAMVPFIFKQSSIIVKFTSLILEWFIAFGSKMFP
jgi:hypothetical protein